MARSLKVFSLLTTDIGTFQCLRKGDLWVALMFVTQSCTPQAEFKGGLPVFPVSTAAATTMSRDTAVTLYYNPEDCFTCFGVLGYWAAIANTTAVTVRLSFDYQPDEKTLQAIRRMRLPFTLGITSREDKHSLRAHATVKEVLTVRGHVVDSAVVRLGATSSPLLDRMSIAEEE